jgi:hypothetical protein
MKAFWQHGLLKEFKGSSDNFRAAITVYMVFMQAFCHARRIFRRIATSEDSRWGLRYFAALSFTALPSLAKSIGGKQQPRIAAKAAAMSSGSLFYDATMATQYLFINRVVSVQYALLARRLAAILPVRLRTVA